ncbi:hypothetical protein OQZ33_02680 [Pedobacter sp. MC2016-05]|uniref:hypothetical protein n=1 Tax=Pedobacter sp. MC2016-05 TaxID=2994474 RepID=UPI0022476241|nr:hypothetical protein [Pedobacter sp. MC2016-05]MCX2473230.1 hypothetical protein [Pedobacter sp. MC2016-05]
MGINREKIEVFLFVFLGGVTFNFGGSLSLSEIYLLLISPFLLRKIKLNNNRELKSILIIYACYIICQILSELVNQNQLDNSLKGFAVTIVSLLSFLYLYQTLSKDMYLIIIALGALVCRNVFFANSLSEDSEMSFFKFYIVPIISNMVLICSYYLLVNRNKLLNFYVFFLVGVFFMLMDARSAGLTLILVGIITQYGRNLKKRLIFAPILLLFIYGIYCVYVNKVLSREFGGDHSYEQLARINNPYNPFALLATGRSETFVALEAIKDEFFFGHGTWAKDVTGKYHLMVLMMHDNDTDGRVERVLQEGVYSVIPAHSVILGAGVYNGIFALFFMLILIVYFIRLGVKSIDYTSPFISILIRTLIGVIWTALFSPITSFKGSLPLFFAIILVTYRRQKKQKSVASFDTSNLSITSYNHG